MSCRFDRFNPPPSPRSGFALMLVLGLAACGGGMGGAGGQTQASEAPSNASYAVTLRIGQPVVIAQEGLTLQLGAIQDSRCPAQVQCVWAGNAVATIIVAQAGFAAESLMLATPEVAGATPPGQASYRGYLVSFKSLDPSPVAPGAIPADQYRAGVVVDKR